MKESVMPFQILNKIRDDVNATFDAKDMIDIIMGYVQRDLANISELSNEDAFKTLALKWSKWLGDMRNRIKAHTETKPDYVNMLSTMTLMQAEMEVATSLYRPCIVVMQGTSNVIWHIQQTLRKMYE
jgi:hypothetical protein